MHASLIIHTINYLNIMWLAILLHCYTCKIDDVKPIIQNSHVCSRHVHDSLLTHVCMSGMHAPSLNYVHASQRYKLYEEHVHVPRCGSLVTQDTNPIKKFLMVKSMD